MEMLGNYLTLRGFADSRADPKFDNLDVSIPTIDRAVYDQHLPLLAQLFSFDRLRSIMQPYAVIGQAGLLMRDRLAKAPERLSPQDVGFLKASSHMFLLGFKTITAAHILRRRERLDIERQLSELPEIEQNVAAAYKLKS